MTARGLRVSVLKHAHHDFDIDRPGRTRFATARRALRSAARQQCALGVDERVARRPSRRWRNMSRISRPATWSSSRVSSTRRSRSWKSIGRPTASRRCGPSSRTSLQCRLRRKRRRACRRIWRWLDLNDTETIVRFILALFNWGENRMLSFEDALSRLLASAAAVAEVARRCRRWRRRAGAGQAQQATVDAPPLDNSAMDGYALAVADVPRAGTPAGLAAHSGRQRRQPLQPGTAARIFTGAPIPAGADAVVMQELCEHAARAVLINHLPQAGEHIRRAGSDIAAGSEILPAGQRLRPQDTALAASVGIASCRSFAACGWPCCLPATNCACLASRCRRGRSTTPIASCSPPARAPRLRRSRPRAGARRSAATRRRCAKRRATTTWCSLGRRFRRRGGSRQGCRRSGGSARNVEDRHQARANRWLSARSHCGDGARWPFIGLPGNPVSCFVTFLMLVRPFLLKMQGVRQVTPASYLLRADFDWLRPDARREFLRARSNADGGVELFANQGSGVLSSAVWGDGLIDNPPQQVIRRGDRFASCRFPPCWTEPERERTFSVRKAA
jgi:molybdopterin molybdotransferase